MNLKKRKSVLIHLRSGAWGRMMLLLLTIQSVNLSVNFSEKKIKIQDPVDTLTEMIYEWGLEGESDVIPDNGTEQEDQNLKSVNLFFPPNFVFEWEMIDLIFFKIQSEKRILLPVVFLNQGTPPPDLP